MSSIEYHLTELEIALDPNDPRRTLPQILASDRCILDIGCGIGQTFIALNCTDRICIGIDVDEKAISYGIKNYGNKIHFILSDAARIPLPANMFDLVYCRVSLPYTNIPKVIREIRRVLKRGGRVWMTLHSKNRIEGSLRESIRQRKARSFVGRAYTLINGYCLKYCGVLFPFINGRYESWQDTPTMRRIMSHYGFEVKAVNVGNEIVYEGVLNKDGEE